MKPLGTNITPLKEENTCFTQKVLFFSKWVSLLFSVTQFPPRIFGAVVPSWVPAGRAQPRTLLSMAAPLSPGNVRCYKPVSTSAWVFGVGDTRTFLNITIIIIKMKLSKGSFILEIKTSHLYPGTQHPGTPEACDTSLSWRVGSGGHGGFGAWPSLGKEFICKWVVIERGKVWDTYHLLPQFGEKRIQRPFLRNHNVYSVLSL